MSGINHLYDIYKKKGEDFLKELFNSEVTINEKMDGSCFSFEKTPSGKFLFFKRDQSSPITLVDRTLMKYYEKPIRYVESLPPYVISKIPVGWRFGTEYFSSSKPQEIEYDELPKNNLILSYIHKRDQNGNIVETIHDKEKLDLWAEVLGISKPPIVFQGKLSEDQKQSILEFVNTPLSDLVEEFQTKSFVRFILSILNPEMEKSTLNSDLDKPIEGLVFRFGNEEKDPVVAKMVDPVFSEIARSKEPIGGHKKSNDILAIVVLDVMNFILSKGLKSFSIEGETDDERYVSFISDVFVKFMNEYSDRYQGMDLNEPEHLKKEEFGLNSEMLKSRAARKWVQEDDSFESLFKLILNSFRKIRKKPGSIVTPDMLGQFNILVKDIEKYVRTPEKAITESEIEFTDFLSFRQKYINEKVDYLTEEDDENSTSDKFIDAIESQDKEKTKILPMKKPSSENEVNLIIGKFQPFDNLDLKIIDHLYEQNGLKSIICIVHPGFDHEGEFPISYPTIKDSIDSLASSNDKIQGVIRAKKHLLTNALEDCYEKNLHPKLIGTETKNLEDFKKQLEYFNKLYSFPDGVEKPEIADLKLPTRDESILKLIKEGNYTLFKKLVPKAIHVNFFEKFKQELDSKES